MSLLVAGILFGIGVPNLLEFSRNNAMAGVANDFVGVLMAARAEAVKRQVPVTVCASPDPMAANPVCVPTGVGATGYFAWVDENNNPVGGIPTLTDPTDGNATVDPGETLLLARSIPDTLTVQGDTGFVTFGTKGQRLDGVPTAFGVMNSARAILMCDARGNVVTAGSLSAARVVQVDRTGRSLLRREIADVGAVAGAAGLVCP